MSVCGTGTQVSTRGFSWRFGFNRFRPCELAITLSSSGLLTPLSSPTSLAPARPTAGRPTLPRHPFAQTTLRGTGILTCCPSPTPFGLGLGPTNPTRTDLPSETLDLRRTWFSHSFTLLMPAFSLLLAPRLLPLSPSPPAERSPTAPYSLSSDNPVASVGGLSPVIFSAQNHVRPVSYYALFQGWLLLSQPPGCLGTLHIVSHLASTSGP